MVDTARLVDVAAHRSTMDEMEAGGALYIPIEAELNRSSGRTARVDVGYGGTIDDGFEIPSGEPTPVCAKGADSLVEWRPDGRRLDVLTVTVCVTNGIDAVWRNGTSHSVPMQQETRLLPRPPAFALLSLGKV